jgi:hypothetical protein
MPTPETKNPKALPSVEFEKMLAQFLSGSAETVKEVERVIKSPDSETKFTYEVQVDPQTGKQKVIEKFTTTKQECGICGGYFAQLKICAECGARVCANDVRRHSLMFYEDSRGNKYPSSLDSTQGLPRDARIKFEDRTICVSCAKTYGIPY